MATSFTPPVDTSLFLEQGLVAVTADRPGLYGGVARVRDHGAATRFDGFVVIDVTAGTFGGGRTYSVVMEASSVSNFASDVIQVWSVPLAAVLQQTLPYSNNIGGVNKQYTRIQIKASGSSPSITVKAWLMPMSAVDDLTTANLVKFMGVVVGQWQNASEDFRAWAAGSATGGPDSDGRYPLRDGSGGIHLVPCPASLALSGGGAGLSKAGVQTLTRHTLIPSSGYPSPEMIGLVGGPDGELRRFSLDLFTSRHTRDMQPLVDLISEELIPSYNASTGLERSIAVGELMRQTMGMVNPLRYGVKNDCLTTRHGFSMGAGDNLVICADPIFRTDCVGKYIVVGGAGAGGIPGKGTVTQRYSAYQVRVSFNSASDISGQDGAVGTYNKTTFQNALNACFNPNGPYNYGAILMLPDGGILVGSQYYLPRTGIMGHGMRQSLLVRWDDSFLTTPGQFPRWDGDVDPFPISTYTDGSYYIPIYPNVYKAPYYAGAFAPEVAPTLCNRIGKDAWGNTWSWNDTGVGQYSKAGQKVDSDFNVFHSFSINGGRYHSQRLLAGFEFRGGLFDVVPGQPAAPYLQVDPYLRMTEIHTFLCGGIGMKFFGQCSATLIGLDSGDNFLAGMEWNGFDSNISNCYFMGNAGPGIICGGTNSNWTTMKISFNGNGETNWMWGIYQSKCNLVINGIGHNFNNARMQESWAANMAVYGRGNDFTGCHFDDTGCIYPYHIALQDGPTIAANMNFISPVIYVGPYAHDLRLNDCGFGGLVHVGQNFASHALFWASDGANTALRTSGRMYSKDVTSYYNSGNAAITGVYAPNEWGSETGSIPATQQVFLDGANMNTF